MLDHFTKHFEVVCVELEKFMEIERKFLMVLIQCYGTPRLVILDRAAVHMSGVFKTLANKFIIKLNYIIGYRPQNNSAIEHVHSKILTSLCTW